jgi:Mg/Co/Ni transporter MgtE
VRRAAALDVDRDNTAVLLAMIGERAGAETAAATEAATAQGDEATGSLEQSANAATTAVAGARASVGGALDVQARALEAGFGSAVAGVDAQGAAATAAVDASATAAGAEIDAQRATNRAAVEEELEARATRMEAAGESEELVAAASAERATIDATAARVVAGYASHEKAADVRTAVQDAAAKAKADVDRAESEAQRQNLEAAVQAAASARDAKPRQAAQVDSMAGDAKAQADAERETLRAGVQDNAAANVAALETAQADGAGELDARRGQADAELAAIEGAANAAMTGAAAATARAGEDVKQKWTAGIEGWKAAAEGEAAGVQAEVGNLFVPEEAAPALDQLTTEGEQGRAALEDATTRVGAEHVAGAQGFADALGGDAANAAASAAADVAGGLSAVEAQAAAAGGALQNAAGSAGGGFEQLGGEAGTAVGSVLDGVRSRGQTGERTVADGLDRASAGGSAQLHQAGAKAAQQMSAAAESAANETWFERFFTPIAEAVATAIAAVAMAIANFCFGFLWGDPIDERWGGKWFAFAGDVIAGLLIFGDLRDLFKWGIWKPFVMGEGWTWENTMNILLALYGLIPIIGDLRKGKKGFDLLVKTTRKELVSQVGDTLAERLVKDLGEEAALGLVNKLGKDAIEKLLKSLDGKAIEALSNGLGPELLKRFAAELEGTAIKKLVDDLGADTVKALAKQLDPKALVNIAGALDAATLKEIATSPDGPKVLRELLDTTDYKTLRALVGDLGWPNVTALQIRWGKERFGKMLTRFTGREIADLEDSVGRELAFRLVDEMGVEGFKDVFTKLGTQLLKRLADKVTLKELKLLAELDQKWLKKHTDEELSDLARAVERYGAKRLEMYFEQRPEVIKEIVLNLLKDPGGRIARCFETLGVGVTLELIREMGPGDLIDAVDAVNSTGIQEMLSKCRDAAQFARLCARFGPEQLRRELAEVRHADWLEMGD